MFWLANYLKEKALTIPRVTLLITMEVGIIIGGMFVT